MRTNALVLNARKSPIAGPYFEVQVGVSASKKTVVVVPESPQVGDKYDDEHVVTWTKPDQEKPGYYVIGLRNTRLKFCKKRTVFTDYMPEIGTWIPVNLI